MRRLFLLSLLALIATTSAQAAEPFKSFNVVLLQPNAVLEQRVPSVDAMAAYIQAVQAASREGVVASGSAQAASGFIVVAVKPGLKSKVWLDFDGLTDLEIQRQIAARVQAVKPFEAAQGPVVFALKVATWGGKESRRTLPSPSEWKAASAEGAPVEVGELVERVWRD